MRTLGNNEWMVLNNIIYKIYTTEDITAMRELLLEQLKMIMDFDSAHFYLASGNDKFELIDQVAYNCDPDETIKYNELDYGREIMCGGKSIVYRDTDIVSDCARTESEYYKKVYKSNNWHYSLQTVLGFNKKFLGIITLYRSIGKDNFVYDDVFIMDMLKEHLAYRLYRDINRNDKKAEKMSLNEVADKYELTKRECMVLSELLNGSDNYKICDGLGISVNTLKKHIQNIYRKLGVKSRIKLFKIIKEN